MSADTWIRCDGCNVCQHGECYACIVGVATGPESHDTCCAARSVTFTRDGLTAVQHGPAVHRVHIERLTGNPVRWSCWCGAEGRCAPDKVRRSVDHHIRYGKGETLVGEVADWTSPSPRGGDTR